MVRAGWSRSTARSFLLAGLVGGVAVAVAATVAITGDDEVGATTPEGDPIVMAAGDIAKPNSNGDNRTAALLGPADLVLALGDEAYPDGTLAQFKAHYAPSWGAYRGKTEPAPGNHEWHTAGAAGYEAYFGQPDRHWYSRNIAGWHLISLDSNCSKVGGCGWGSPQYTWLKADLARNTARCVLAFWHHPRYTVGAKGRGATMVQPFWKLLYAHRADVILNGHDHNYQRWRQLDAGGRASRTGIRQFVVGTGGAALYRFRRTDWRVQRRNASTHGVLRIVLRPSGYDWRFLPAAGATFTDSGSAACHTP